MNENGPQIGPIEKAIIETILTEDFLTKFVREISSTPDTKEIDKDTALRDMFYGLELAAPHVLHIWIAALQGAQWSLVRDQILEHIVNAQ